ncbi:MAG: L-dopachrome tautomerase-related protein [Thermodesulfobacteriota bacterium]
MNRSALVVIPALFLVGAALPGLAAPQKDLARDKPVGKIEAVAFFTGPLPTGVTVSRSGRIFVNFPQWGDKVDATVAEVKKGKTVAYPNEKINRCDKENQKDCFVSVQSVVVDPKDRLWVLDTGSIGFGPTTYGGPKMVGIDLQTNQIFKKILFPQDVALPTTYLNDVRFDLRRGTEGFAFITDSGANGIIVVDLASGKSWRRLHNHPSTKPEKGFLAIVEGRPLMLYLPNQKPFPLAVGADGIAISSDGSRLYYSPLSSRRLYSVSVDGLIDAAVTDEKVAETVKDHGDKGGASDGLESDAKGRIYLSDYEHNAIHRMMPDGSIETIAHDPRMLWPDTLCVAYDGYLYFTVNQIERQVVHRAGKDMREKPYVLFRIKIDAEPVALK